MRRHSWSRCLGRVLRETTGERWGMEDMDQGWFVPLQDLRIASWMRRCVGL